MMNKLCDSNKRVIGNITDVVRTVDGGDDDYTGHRPYVPV